jgi:hypothetical protein
MLAARESAVEAKRTVNAAAPIRAADLKCMDIVVLRES